jgi:predicted enzyme related to lactoylglutathione lyase
MKRVTGIGGIFFRTSDPKRTAAWYERHLGLPVDPEQGSAMFGAPDEGAGDSITIWSPFESDTQYFGSSGQPFMVNYRVDNLDALLAALQAEGVQIDSKREDQEYGRFAWIVDCDGNRVELWEPAPAGA